MITKTPKTIPSVFLLTLALTASCASGLTPAAQTVTSQDAVVTLTVGLYPWVPRPQQLQDAVQAAWSQVQPDVALVFKSKDEWDGGYGMNPAGMDVFVFDATFIDYFRSQDLLMALTPAQVDNADDFLTYAGEGAQYGGNYYGLPVYGCANLLYYKDGDAPLAAATKLSEVESTLNQCTYTSQVPPDVRGLLVDMAGGTTSASLYVDMLHSINGAWPVPLPTDASQLNTTVIAESQTMLQTSSYYNATTDPPEAMGSYARAIWFSNGNGRALMAFTEAMSLMSDTTRSTVQFKPFPLGETPASQPLFYSDMAAVSPLTAHPDLAIQLANLIASTPVLLAGMQAQGGDPAQYLMPVRTSLFEALEQGDDIYTRMEAMVSGANPIMFNLGDTARTYIDSMKTPIRTAIRANYACGCDQDGGNLSSQAQADQTCPGVCTNFGGWNGQWTPYPPGATNDWQSGCGCKVCPGQ